jgi:hypothetical protein
MSTGTDNLNGQAEATELAHRAGGGIEVSLLWIRDEDRLEVVVRQLRSGRSFELPADDGRQALDTFYHPFAYAAARGIADGKEARSDESATPRRTPPASSVRRA